VVQRLSLAVIVTCDIGEDAATRDTSFSQVVDPELGATVSSDFTVRDAVVGTVYRMLDVA